MYLVLIIQNNRPFYNKAFNTFDEAVDHADDLVMNLSGVANEMPDWWGGEVYTGPTGEVVAIVNTQSVDKTSYRYAKNNTMNFYNGFIWNKKNNKKN